MRACGGSSDWSAFLVANPLPWASGPRRRYGCALWAKATAEERAEIAQNLLASIRVRDNQTSALSSPATNTSRSWHRQKSGF